ncbi:hypothetical protein AAV94_01010 [Lampropedia cohaerens]|uniref:Pilus assembly protein PilW n=1 Tax=Lampropedia cohaerens TaxID=1610491 RepID=A0A0U1Q317_9BURK|nr:prepilin-type N-terminal cleavage/methylation domain-containing protein [Lampropedia cohaerens]KKW69025.1 hypothetical protein AAV94_01010 [Lampropedia cohaerens]
MSIRKGKHSARRPAPVGQQGFTLLELIVGMVLGLLVIAAALGSLLLTRSTSAVTSDLTQLQQTAAYALRVIGVQIRQAGSYEPVAATGGFGSGDAITFKDYTSAVVTGDEASFTVATQTPMAMRLRRDCLGNAVMTSEFLSTLAFDADSASLLCGNGAQTQPIIGNVTDFRVRYRNFTVNGAGNYSFQIAEAPQPSSATAGVAAVEVCLELQGDEPVPDAGAGGKYVNCDGQAVPMGDRIRRVFHNTYSLRVRGA